MKKDKYRGADHRFVICDVCGGKFRVYETVQIDDRYSTQNKMIVCKKDADKINPQIYPIYLREELLSNKEYVRPEPTDLTVPLPNSDQLPGVPQNLRLEGAPLNNFILVTWDGPAQVGSSPILGYRITRADPQQSTQDFLVNVTDGSSYIDITSDVDRNYTYQVAAYSILGLGPYTDFAYWPISMVNPDTTYIATDLTAIISTDSGDTLIL